MIFEISSNQINNFLLLLLSERNRHTRSCTIDEKIDLLISRKSESENENEREKKCFPRQKLEEKSIRSSQSTFNLVTIEKKFDRENNKYQLD